MRVDEAHDTITPTKGSRPSVWRRPIVAFAGMALFLLVVVGGAVVLFGGLEGPTADTAPTTLTPTTEAIQPTSSTVPETTTSTAPQSTAGDLVSIERIADESLVGTGMRIWDLAVGGPGIVAVGEVDTPDDIDSVWGGTSMDAVIWVSADGRNWDRVDDPGLFGGDDWDELHAIWSSSTGLIAQGRDAQAPYPDVVWYASTDGYDWTLITDEDLYSIWERMWRSGFDPRFEFYAGEVGWVAALLSDAPEPTPVFVSADGMEWDTTEESLASLIEPQLEAPQAPGSTAFDSGDSDYPWNLAGDGDEVVAVRYHAEPKVAVSTNGGDTWLQVDPETFGEDYPLVAIDVVRFGNSYVIGGNSSASAEVWILEWKDEDS